MIVVNATFLWCSSTCDCSGVFGWFLIFIFFHFVMPVVPVFFSLVKPSMQTLHLLKQSLHSQWASFRIPLVVLFSFMIIIVYSENVACLFPALMMFPRKLLAFHLSSYCTKCKKEFLRLIINYIYMQHWNMEHEDLLCLNREMDTGGTHPLLVPTRLGKDAAKVPSWILLW